MSTSANNIKKNNGVDSAGNYNPDLAEPKRTVDAPSASGYQTPTGVYSGTPDILYPNTPGYKPNSYIPVGGVVLANDDIEYNANRRTKKIVVRNTGDRPIQVGSHFHFFEVNRYMEFDRPETFGYHLNIPATTAIRFEPGDEKEVELVAFAGKTRAIGFNDLVNGYTGMEDGQAYYPTKIKAINKMTQFGFKNAPLTEVNPTDTTTSK